MQASAKLNKFNSFDEHFTDKNVPFPMILIVARVEKGLQCMWENLWIKKIGLLVWIVDTLGEVGPILWPFYFRIEGKKEKNHQKFIRDNVFTSLRGIFSRSAGAWKTRWEWENWANAIKIFLMRYERENEWKRERGRERKEGREREKEWSKQKV